MMFFASPPFDNRGNPGQRAESCITHHAQDVQVRIFRMKFALRGRAVQDHTYQITRSRGPHLLNKIADELVFRHLLSPHQLPLAPPPPDMPPPPKPPKPPPPPPNPPPPQPPPPPLRYPPPQPGPPPNNSHQNKTFLNGVANTITATMRKKTIVPGEIPGVSR